MPKSAELAAFPTRSRAPPKEKVSRTTKGEGSSSPRAPAIVAQSLQLQGVEQASFELCKDPEAGLSRHLQDAEQLAKAFETVVNGQSELVSKVIALTEERCAAEKRAAVEAATRAAIQATEVRCANERRTAVEEAVRETAAAAKLAQDAAVAEAIRITEERCAEQTRAAVYEARGAATLNTARMLKTTEEDLLTTRVQSEFEEAAASAGAALAAVSSLLEGRTDPTPPPAALPNAVPEEGTGSVGDGKGEDLTLL
mmetsp:Transcript_17070/g.43851  ORF Transcript_17070/g.43851 Transcript_17070/m.43851 type:complete len:255 (-) Transcript_17070:415-1179(-)